MAHRRMTGRHRLTVDADPLLQASGDPRLRTVVGTSREKDTGWSGAKWDRSSTSRPPSRPPTPNAMRAGGRVSAQIAAFKSVNSRLSFAGTFGGQPRPVYEPFGDRCIATASQSALMPLSDRMGLHHTPSMSPRCHIALRLGGLTVTAHTGCVAKLPNSVPGLR
jgi:hypothetical protein